MFSIRLTFAHLVEWLAVHLLQDSREVSKRKGGVSKSQYFKARVSWFTYLYNVSSQKSKIGKSTKSCLQKYASVNNFTDQKVWRHQKIAFKNLENLRSTKYSTSHYNQKRYMDILNYLQRFGHQRPPKIVPQCDLAKVPEAINRKPLTFQVSRWHHRLQSTRQLYRQNLVKIKIMVVLNWIFLVDLSWNAPWITNLRLHLGVATHRQPFLAVRYSFYDRGLLCALLTF